MLRRFNAFIQKQESRPHSWLHLIIISFFVAAIRSVEETLFFKEPITGYSIINMTYFYLAFGFFITALVTIVTGRDFKRVQNAVQLGLFLGLFPPLIDYILSDGRTSVRYSYYLYTDLSHLPYYFYAPQQNMPLGEATTIWLSIFFIGYYVYYATKSLLRSVAASLGLYIFFIALMALIPMAIVSLTIGNLPITESATSQRVTQANAWVTMFPFLYTLIIGVCFLALRRPLIARVHIRFLHALPFVLAALLGGFQIRESFSIEVLSVAFMALILYFCMALQNDYYDERDRTQKTIRMSESDVQFLYYFVFLVLFWIILFNKVSAILLALVYALSILYHHPLYRAKRYFLANMKIEGAWGALTFLAGALVYPIVELPAGFALKTFLVFGGFSWLSVWKDLKDVRQDKRDKNESLYLFCMKRGLSLSKVHRLISAVLVAVLTLPIFALIQKTQYFVAALIATLVLVFAIMSFFPRMHNWFRKILFLLNCYIGILCYIGKF